MPDGHDEEIAIIFKEMRRASECSMGQLAAELKTPVATLEMLEAGEIRALPEWSETRRVIEAYAGRLGLDSRPVLRRLQAQLAAFGGMAEPQSTPPDPDPGPGRGTPAAPDPEPARQHPEPDAPPPAPAPAEAQATPAAAESPGGDADAAAPAAPYTPERRPLLSSGTLVTWAILLALFAAMGLGVHYAATHPQLVWSTVERLPDPAPRIVRTVRELVRPSDGGGPGTPRGTDPKTQKSDRLSVGPQPSGQ